MSDAEVYSPTWEQLARDAQIEREELRAALAEAQGKVMALSLNQNVSGKDIFGWLEAWNERGREIEALQRDLAEAHAERDRALAFARKAGHLGGCKVETCRKCEWNNELHDWDQRNQVRYGNHSHVHEFQPGPCTCGLAELGVEP